MNAYANYNAANVSQPRLFSPATIYEMEHFRHGSMGNHLPLPLAVKTLDRYWKNIPGILYGVRPSVQSFLNLNPAK